MQMERCQRQPMNPRISVRFQLGLRVSMIQHLPVPPRLRSPDRRLQAISAINHHCDNGRWQVFVRVSCPSQEEVDENRRGTVTQRRGKILPALGVSAPRPNPRLCRVSKAIWAVALPVLYHYYATGNSRVETNHYRGYDVSCLGCGWSRDAAATITTTA